MITAADALEARAERRGELRGELKGERRGKQKGRVEVLLQFGKTDDEIVQYLTADIDDPLTEDEAAEILESYRNGNQ